MTTLLNIHRVKYQCSCGSFKSLCYLYFCRHCLKIKCKDCVILEVILRNYQSKEKSDGNTRDLQNCPGGTGTGENRVYRSIDDASHSSLFMIQ